MTDYRAERLREELARDPRVGRLGIELTVHDGRVRLRGEVATAERKECLVEAVALLAPDLAVDDSELRVRTMQAPEYEILP